MFDRPVEIINGFLYLIASLIKGKLLDNPDDIFIISNFNFINLLKLEISPGVAKNKILFFFAYFFNFTSCESEKSLF